MENTSTAEDEREVMVPGRGPAERQESEGLRARAASARKEQAGERASTRPETPKGPDVPAREKSRETRTYKGVIYEKGDDGQWHRQQN
jgi:hypothetical protein